MTQPCDTGYSLRQFRKRYSPWFVVLIAAMTFTVFGPSSVFWYVWLDVRSVEVTSDLMVKADRKIQQDFWGRFTVELRAVQNDDFICSGNADLPAIRYRSAANKKNPLVMSLRKWASLNHPSEVATCLRNGFQADRPYYLVTCHSALLGSVRVPIAQRCVHSDWFAPSTRAIEALRRVSSRELSMLKKEPAYAN